jgi:hypothetical protein
VVRFKIAGEGGEMTHTDCKVGPVQKQGNFGGYGFVVWSEQNKVVFSVSYDTEARAKEAHNLMTKALDEAEISVG